MTRRRVEAILVGVVALLLMAAGAPGDTTPGDAKVSGVVGKVDVAVSPGSEWRAAQVGDVLPPGAELRTGAASRAELRLDGAVARLYELSLVRIPAGAAGQARIDLDRGASSFDITPRHDAPFEVHTPNTVALAKGTRFTVTADGDGSTVSVRRGLVGVRASDSVAREVLVHPGFGVTGGAGRPFALGLLNQRGDPWEAWSRGAAPLRPLERPPEMAQPPASAEGVEVTLQGAGDDALQIVAERGPKRVKIFGVSGLEATLTKRDLSQVLRGNTAALGPMVLSTLRLHGVTPAAFAHQVLDNL
jgi:hypothetical protein